MLRGGGAPGNLPEEVKGIPVGRRADALFFLHTMKLDHRMNADEWKKGRRYETLRYVVHYAGGETANVPVYAEYDIHHYRQKTPRVIQGAEIAWAAKFAGSDEHAVAYAMQWTNPRPDVEVRSIDMLYGKERRGVPVLLALTAATAE